MKLIFDKKYYLLKNIVLITCFFLTAGFIIKKNENKFLNIDTVVNVEQQNNNLTVSVKTSKNINIRFYMFTVQGRQIKELNIYGSKRVSIAQLEKGIYTYDFFSNDERLKNGKIELK